jgi:uncharacterized protein YcbK (DUF882 family)
MTGPSPHLTWNELDCWNHTGSLWGTFAPGERIAPYPQRWRDERASAVANNFETVRELLGNEPILIFSAYRTAPYNAHVGGATMSQHVQGRALDFRHRRLAPREVFARLLDLQKIGALPLLGGLGSYGTFTHMDVRPKVGGRLATWIY